MYNFNDWTTEIGLPTVVFRIPILKSIAVYIINVIISFEIYFSIDN